MIADISGWYRASDFCVAGKFTALLLLILGAASSGAQTTAGYDKTFFIQSEDQNYRLNVKLFGQFRYVANQTDDDGDESTTVRGFEERRTRVFLFGHAFSPRLKYKIMQDFNASSGVSELFDVHFDYALNDQWTATAGQFRLPFNREQLMGAGAQLGMDRTQLNYAFNLGGKGGRSQGVQLKPTVGEFCTATQKAAREL